MSFASTIRRTGMPRMLLATLVLALLDIGVGELVMSVGLTLVPVVRDSRLGKVEEEARRMAAESAEREAAIRPEYRLAVWRIGLRLGYAGQYIGLRARSSTA